MAKTKLPLSLLTSYINQAWSVIDQVKTDIDAVKKEYADTAVFENILQSISDAYLIAAGRLQKLVKDKDYIEVPKDADLELKEDLVLKIEDTNSEDDDPLVEINFDELDLFNQEAPAEEAKPEEDTKVVEKPVEAVKVDDEDEDDVEVPVKKLDLVDNDENVENESKLSDDDIIDDFPAPLAKDAITDDDLYR